jgi:hypothetical protein
MHTCVDLCSLLGFMLAVAGYAAKNLVSTNHYDTTDAPLSTVRVPLCALLRQHLHTRTLATVRCDSVWHIARTGQSRLAHSQPGS